MLEMIRTIEEENMSELKPFTDCYTVVRLDDSASRVTRGWVVTWCKSKNRADAAYETLVKRLRRREPNALPHLIWRVVPGRLGRVGERVRLPAASKESSHG